MLAISVRSGMVAALVPSDCGRCPHIERVFERGLVAHCEYFLTRELKHNTTDTADRRSF
jgi:hypothetical protein